MERVTWEPLCEGGCVEGLCSFSGVVWKGLCGTFLIFHIVGIRYVFFIIFPRVSIVLAGTRSACSHPAGDEGSKQPLFSPSADGQGSKRHVLSPSTGGQMSEHHVFTPTTSFHGS